MKHGCFNTPRKPGYWANDGYWFVGNLPIENGNLTRKVTVVQVEIKDTMTPGCQYSKGVPDDPKCEGCEKKGK